MNIFLCFYCKLVVVAARSSSVFHSCNSHVHVGPCCGHDRRWAAASGYWRGCHCSENTCHNYCSPGWVIYCWLVRVRGVHLHLVLKSLLTCSASLVTYAWMFRYPVARSVWRHIEAVWTVQATWHLAALARVGIRNLYVHSTRKLVSQLTRAHTVAQDARVILTCTTCVPTVLECLVWPSTIAYSRRSVAYRSALSWICRYGWVCRIYCRTSYPLCA